MSDALQCSLAARRLAAGLSLAGLAARVGVSRQALGAVEAGRSTPSTALALALARELSCRVEDLFRLGPPRLPGLRCPDLAGARVSLAQVAGLWVAHALDSSSGTPADGLVDSEGSIELLRDPSELRDSALVAGCAPALGVLTGRHARWLQMGSSEALRLLAEGRVHMAGLHLADRDRPELHDALVRERVRGSVELVSLLGWREGLITAPGNPLGLRELGDLARLRIARRPEGSGAARVLSRALAESGVEPLPGPLVQTHADLARAVLLGAADTGVVIEPVAEALGLPFLPLSEERFELAIRTEHMAHPGVARLMDTLASAGFARDVGAMGALDLASLGDSRRVSA